MTSSGLTLKQLFTLVFGWRLARISAGHQLSLLRIMRLLSSLPPNFVLSHPRTLGRVCHTEGVVLLADQVLGQKIIIFGSKQDRSNILELANADPPNHKNELFQQSKRSSLVQHVGEMSPVEHTGRSVSLTEVFELRGRRPRFGVRVPVGSEIFSSPRRPDKLSGAHPAFYPTGTGVRRPRPETDHSSPARADVKKMWI
jgi:hypothetical protein